MKGDMCEVMMVKDAKNGKLVGNGDVSGALKRHHQTWTGNSLWTRHEFSMADNVEELDDDDLSSIWIESLKYGIPWGGKGLGGRGVTRVTGETKDVYLENISMSRNLITLVEGATLKLVHGKRYALSGSNGCGKSTLLGRIARGTLPGFPPWLRVQYVQQHMAGSDMTPIEEVLKYDFERTRLFKEEEEILEKLETDASLDLQERLSVVYERLEQISAYDAETRAEVALREIGFTDELLQKPTSELSGGWRMRVALTGTSFMMPDVLLLDEADNHLDCAGINWLTRLLQDRERFPCSVLIVSHNRAFIDAVTDEMIFFRNKMLTYFKGNYDEYSTMVAQKGTAESKKLMVMQKKKDHLNDFVRTQQRAARDKKSKGGDQKKQKQIRQAKKRLDRMEVIGLGRADGKTYMRSRDGYGVPAAIDYPEKPLSMIFPQPSSADKLEVSLENISFGWTRDKALVNNFTAQIRANSRIGIVGQNGLGKSTLVGLLQGKLQPTRGNLVPHGGLLGNNVGYFDQQMVSKLDTEPTAVEKILSLPRGASTVNCQTEADARAYLGSFGLKGDKALRPLGVLSGGERARVVFAVQLYTKPSVLILDEATCHLDIESVQVLKDAVASYSGTIILISHDKHFLESLVTEFWVFTKKSNKIMIKTPELSESPAEFTQRVWKLIER